MNYELQNYENNHPYRDDELNWISKCQQWSGAFFGGYQARADIGRNPLSCARAPCFQQL